MEKINVSNSLDKQYIDLLKDIVENGTKKMDRTGTGTISVFGRTIRHKMSEGFPLLTSKKMYTKGIITELLWFLRGETNIRPLVEQNCNIWNGDAYKRYRKFTSDNSSQWNKWMRDNGDGTLSMYTMEEFVEAIKTDNDFMTEWGDLGPIYGFQWRSWGDHLNNRYIDQIQNSIDLLKTQPDSRRNIVSAWNVAEIDAAVLPPCHTEFQLYTRELTQKERLELLPKYNTYGVNEIKFSNYMDIATVEEIDSLLDNSNVPKRAISLMWKQRSVDTPLGLPFNIASYGLLLCLYGHLVNMVPDELIGNLGDTHIYLNQLDGVNEQINRVSHDLPTLHINGEFWSPNFDDPKVQEVGCSNTPGSFNTHFDTLIKGIVADDFIIENYVSEPIIKFPLSN